MSVQTSELEDLVIKAFFIKDHLDDLQEKLRDMYNALTRENTDYTMAECELLSTLWSKLGGNVLDKKKFHDNFLLLNQLTDYHRQARDRVAAAVFTLNNMRNQMKEVKKAVGAQGIAGPKIPLDVQMNSIRDATDNLERSIIAAREQRRSVSEKLLIDQ